MGKLSVSQTARRMNVDERMVHQVRQVQGTGDRELISAVLEGKLSLDDACQIAAQHVQSHSQKLAKGRE